MNDSPNIAKRRAREIRTVSQMICIYCRGNHTDSERNEQASCGESLCQECKQLDDYAALRTKRCPRMAEKTSCNECPKHCYRPSDQERIRAVMRYAGPRMLLHHPVAGIRHLLGK